MEEAFYASTVELIKITIIGLPLLLIAGVGLYLLRRFEERS
ncbi:MAG: LPXTG cell wall anchor domain-containing protein [Rubrobacter sp.]|nr:LPXTG cell wall anchor domain-containing protein [Rubrobacter sp.]